MEGNPRAIRWYTCYGNMFLDMDQNKKKIIKVKIEKRIISTKEDIIELKKLTAPIEPENAIGRISRMDAINNKSINDFALRKALDKFKNLQLALSRIDEHNFGKCRLCNTEIQEGRLLLMPENNTCVKCASK